MKLKLKLNRARLIVIGLVFMLPGMMLWRAYQILMTGWHPSG